MKKNLVPIFLVIFMILNIAAAFVFKHWIFMFVAAQLLIFHLLPPFAVLLSMLAYKKRLRFWFKQFEWEKKFYRKIKVKQWKNRFPTYDSKLFNISADSKENVIKAMIQSENVHLLLVFLSFVPLMLSKYYDHFGIMLILSIFFSVLHFPFVIIQRYNLPRVINAPITRKQQQSMKLIGKGLTAEVFELSEDKVIKLFNKDYPKQAIRREFRNARLVNTFKINAPQAFEMKEVDGRCGIVYGYVKGQCIESVFNSRVDLERNLQAFCQLQKSFYNHKKLFMLDYKIYGRALVAGSVSDKKDAAEYIKFIKSFPNANTVVHGDFHPLNVFVEDDGSLQVIDFMNMMRAPAEYDIARTYYLIGAVSAEFAEAYLSVMGYTAESISDYIELVKLYRKLEG